MASLADHLHGHAEGFRRRADRGVALAIFSAKAACSNGRCIPMPSILQVTPVVAIAPLILIWVGFEHINLALVLIAGMVAFFPILSNTTLGLKSADFNLIDLMRLYGASRWQILWRLQLPTALPYLLAGMKIGRRAGADRRGGGGVRRRLRHRHRPGLAHHRSRQPAGDRHDVRGPGAAGAAGHRDLRRPVAAGMGAAAPLARKRDHAAASFERRAVSRIASIARQKPITSAADMYQAGASGEPVGIDQPGDA